MAEKDQFLQDSIYDAVFVGFYFSAPTEYVNCVVKQVCSFNSPPWYENWCMEKLFTYFLTHKPAP